MTDLVVEVGSSDGLAVPLSLAEIEAVVTLVLVAESVPEAELSVALVTDLEIASLNERYLAHHGPTDVISFPLHRPGGPPLGDVYIGVEQAARQAAEAGIDVREEVLRLAVHGTLHILGYEHPETDERNDSPMYRRQETLLASYLSASSDD